MLLDLWSSRIVILELQGEKGGFTSMMRSSLRRYTDAAGLAG